MKLALVTVALLAASCGRHNGLATRPQASMAHEVSPHDAAAFDAEAVALADLDRPFRAVDVAVDNRQLSCALSDDGRVACWGGGTLPGGDTVHDTGDSTPRQLPWIDHARALVVHEGTVCIVTAQGEVDCWRSGHGDRLRIVGVRDVVSLHSTGDAGFCAVERAGTVACWGRVDWLERSDDRNEFQTAARVPGLRGVERLTCLPWGCCTLGADPLCTGQGEDAFDRPVGGPRPVAPSRAIAKHMAVAADVASSTGHGCAIDSKGAVGCWGDAAPTHPDLPQAGVEAIAVTSQGTITVSADGTLRAFERDQLQVLASDAVAVSGSDDHRCYVSRGGSVHCWGRNELGQLGDGAPVQSGTPLPVVGLDDVVALEGAHASACALRSDAVQVCWGELNSRPVPTLSGVARLGDGQWLAGCAVMTSGGATCSYSGLGGGDWSEREYLSVGDLGPLRAVTIDRANNICVVAHDGAVACQTSLGEGGRDAKWVRAEGVINATSIVSTALGWCARQESGAVACFEDHRFDYDEDFVDPLRSIRATRVEGVAEAVELAAGQDLVCARMRDARVLCRGTLGFSNEWHSGTEPVEVEAFAGATSISANHFHVCAVVSGEVRCFGDNRLGQLGDGTRVGRVDPVSVPLAVKATAVAVGERHSCAVGDDRRVYCWGQDDRGQLGRGRPLHAEQPIRVVGIGTTSD